MTAIKMARPPEKRIWLDPLPRYSWEYEKTGRIFWHGDYGPDTDGIGIRHEIGWHAFTERGIRRKLARRIRAERRDNWRRYTTKRHS